MKTTLKNTSILASLVIALASLTTYSAWALSVAETPKVDFQVNNCTIPVGKSSCVASVFVRAQGGRSFDVTNLERGITTANLLSPSNQTNVIGSKSVLYVSMTSSGSDTSNALTYGYNTLILKEKGSTLSTRVAKASCAKGSAWDGKSCVKGGSLVCSEEVRSCEDGTLMPRDSLCGWQPAKCAPKAQDKIKNPSPSGISLPPKSQTGILSDPTNCIMAEGSTGSCMPGDGTIEMNPTNTTPVKPSGKPIIQIVQIGDQKVYEKNSLELSQSPIAPLSVAGEITSIQRGLSMKVTSERSDFFMVMPIDDGGRWTSDISPTPKMYRSRLLFPGKNTLTFTVMDDTTKEMLTTHSVSVYLSPVRSGILIDPPICMMAEGSTGSCMPADGTIEMNPTNTFSPPKKPSTGSGIKVISLDSCGSSCPKTPVEVVIVDMPTKTPPPANPPPKIENPTQIAPIKPENQILMATGSTSVTPPKETGSVMPKSLKPLKPRPKNTPLLATE